MSDDLPTVYNLERVKQRIKVYTGEDSEKYKYGIHLAGEASYTVCSSMNIDDIIREIENNEWITLKCLGGSEWYSEDNKNTINLYYITVRTKDIVSISSVEIE